MRRFEILLIGLCVLATYGLFSYATRLNDQAAQTEFQAITSDGTKALEQRMGTYLQSLNATAAFWSTSEKITAQDFENYVSTLNIDEFLPGTSGIGMIEPVQSDQEAAFIAGKAALGEAAFRIHPQTGNAEKFVISQIAPRAANAEAVGLDITFESGRRNAALQARATGTPQLTPRILLVQDERQEPGFLLLLPVNAQVQTGDPSTNGPMPFIGWVYAPFVARDLLENLTAEQERSYDFQVFDGPIQDPDMLIFSSSDRAEPSAQYQNSLNVALYGRDWTVAFQSKPGFDANFNTFTPAAVLLIGALLTIGLSLLVHALRVRDEAQGQVAAFRAREISAREEENRSIIENEVTAVFILDDAQRILFANQAAVQCFGYRLSDLTGMCFVDIITRVEGDASIHSYNASGRTRAGQLLMLDLQRNNWLTSEGEPRVTAIVRDLTVEFATQKELENTKSLYDMALRGAQIGVFDLDLNAGVSEVSDTWREIMGIPLDDGALDTQKVFLARIHPDDKAKLAAADAGCIAGETHRSICEYRMKFDDGEWRWMRSDAVIVERDGHGKALRMIGTQSDVTDVYHSRNALETSEKRFRQVISSAPIGMALMSEDGRFLEVNDAFCTLSGYRESYLLTQARLSDLLSHEELKTLYHGVMGLVETNSAEPYRAEHQLIHRSGIQRWGLFNVSWTFDKNANSNFFIAQINDITDQKKMEQIKNEFVSTVSHELRTPLTSIKGALGLIQAAESTGMKDSSRRLIEIAKSNTDRLTTIVNDILDLEKISSGDVAFDFDSIDICELIEDVAQEMSPFAITHKTVITTDLSEGAIFVRADQSRTKQVLANLISNACKYSIRNSEILVKAEQLESKAIIYVQNSGPGIPDSFRPQMFQAFSQADGSDTRAKGGTGLGLNISKQIVKRHNGEIGFESIPNSITVFWFTYPLAQAKPKPVAQLPPKRDPVVDQSKLSVLHIEGDRDFAEVIKTSLTDVATVTNANSLAQARLKLATMDIDAIILDWILPDGNAVALLDEIFDTLPNVRVLCLSSESDTRRDPRLTANLVKSRTELSRISDYVSGRIAQAS